MQSTTRNVALGAATPLSLCRNVVVDIEGLAGVDVGDGTAPGDIIALDSNGDAVVFDDNLIGVTGAPFSVVVVVESAFATLSSSESSLSSSSAALRLS